MIVATVNNRIYEQIQIFLYLGRTFVTDKRTVFLHIGVFKTGSSALQVFFAKNQDTLAKHGVEYPGLSELNPARRGLVTSGNAPFIARSLMDEEKPFYLPDHEDEHLTAFRQHLQQTKTPNVLFSSEFFSYVPPAGFEKLKEIAESEGFTLKVLAYVREQASYLESLYIQRVKRGSVQDLPEVYIDQIVEDEQHLFYASLFESLADVIGQENLSIKAFVQKSLFSSTLSALGVKAGPEFNLPSSKVNVSLPLALVPLFVELNTLKPTQTFSDQIVRDYSKFLTSSEPEKRTLLSPEFTSKIRGIYAAENQRLSNEWFGGKAAFKYSERKYLSWEAAGHLLDAKTVAKIFGGLAIQHEVRLIRLEKAAMKLGELAGLEDGWATKIKVR